MPDNNTARAQRSPSPKAGSSVQPPLSKYYYGPAQGWASTEVSPSNNGTAIASQSHVLVAPQTLKAPTDAKCLGSSWSLNAPPEQALNLASRQSPGPPPYSPASWARNYPSQSEPVQGWQHHLGSPARLPEDQFIDSYALMHGGGRNSTVNPTWESNSPRASMDLSGWGTSNQRLKFGQSPEPPAKPPLPVSWTHRFSIHCCMDTDDNILVTSLERHPTHTRTKCSLRLLPLINVLHTIRRSRHTPRNHPLHVSPPLP